MRKQTRAIKLLALMLLAASSPLVFAGQAGELFLRGRSRVYARKYLDAISMPLGGIGSGNVQINVTWDADEDGVPMGQQANTLDAELSGSTSWLGTLYLAALAASQKMALLEGQAELARRYREIRSKGGEKQDSTLFNGEYYIQIPNEIKGENYLTGCHTDQLLGQWWANQLDLGWLYPPGNIRTALESLYRYNFFTDFKSVSHNKQEIAAAHKIDRGKVTVTLQRPVEVRAGQSLVVELR